MKQVFNIKKLSVEKQRRDMWSFDLAQPLHPLENQETFIPFANMQIGGVRLRGRNDSGPKSLLCPYK